MFEAECLLSEVIFMCVYFWENLQAENFHYSIQNIKMFSHCLVPLHKPVINETRPPEPQLTV